MPIDFVAVAAQFAEPLATQTRRLPRTFATLAASYAKWGRQVAEAEKEVAGIPVVRFRDGAVGVRVERVRSIEPFDVGADLAAGGTQFLSGLHQVVTAVEQELLLPNLIDVGARFATRLDERTERTLGLAPEIFAAADASFLDLPALGVLAVRMAADAGFLDPSPNEAPTSGDGASSPATGDGTSSIADLLGGDVMRVADVVAGGVIGVALVLPAATTLLAGHVRVVSATFQLLLVERLVGIEYQLRSFRGRVLETLYEAADAAYVLEYWIAPLVLLVEVDVTFVTLLLPSLVGSLLTRVGDFVAAVNAVSQLLVPILDAVFDVWDFFMNLDLLGGVGGVSLTIGELLDFALFSEVKLIMTELGLGLITISVATPLLPGRDRRIFRSFGEMFLMLAMQPVPELSTPPPPRTVPMPDIVGHVLPARLDGIVGGFLGDVGSRVSEAATGALGASAGAMTDLGRLAEEIVDRTSHGVANLTAAARTSGEWADRVFGPEIENERQAAETRATAHADDPVLQFVSTGMAVAGGLLPHYVAGLQRFLARRPVTLTPVSPHVLARHGRLVGVRTDRLTVRMVPQALDVADARVAAGMVRDGIVRTYTDGRRRLEQAVGELRETGVTPAGRPAAVIGAGR